MTAVFALQSIGYLFGQYTKMRNEWSGALTGKPVAMGGSYLRPEATGYGLIYFVQHILVRAHLLLRGRIARPNAC